MLAEAIQAYPRRGMLRTLQAHGRFRRISLWVSTGGALIACGSPPPTAPTTPPSPIVAEAREKPVDLSPVPEPPLLVMVGRVSKPESIVSAVGAWTHLPLPNSRELLRSITDDSVAEVVDLSQPIDGAVTVSVSRGGVDPLYAFAVAVRGFEFAKNKLGELHRLTAGPNGQFKVEGIGRGDRTTSAPPDPRDRGRTSDEHDDDGDDDSIDCVLAHAAPSAAPTSPSAHPDAGDTARLVCGARAGLASLVPYLTRTMPRERWSTDIHVEVRPEPVRAPLTELRGSLPVVARSLLGSASPAVRDFVDASAGELLDIVNDTQKLSFDGQVADSGIDVSTRLDFQSNKSVFARTMTISDRADVPPVAYFHLPEDTDTAFFGRGSDAKLFEHPRELLANLLIEVSHGAGMPESERKLLRDLVADRMLALFTNGGTSVYAKGYDHAAVERVLRTRVGLKWDDTPAQAEAKKAIAEQVIGWHLYQVSEPIAKVGPVLKDWSTLWNRPAFAKWVLSKANGGSPSPPRMRIAPLPVGVTLPKETVHLEISVPRDDVDDERGMAGSASPPPANAIGSSTRSSVKPAAKAKKIHRSPIVFHVLAVPDGGATWLAFGLDAKLVAQKAAASLASAPDVNTLGKAASHEALREGMRAAGKINGGGMATIRGLAILTALDNHGGKSSPLDLLASLPSKGSAPILFTSRAEPPSAAAKAGSATGTFHVTRVVIEDLVKFVLASR